MNEPVEIVSSKNVKLDDLKDLSAGMFGREKDVFVAIGKVMGAGFFEGGPLRISHSFNYDDMVYIIKGELIYIVEGKEYRSCSGDAVHVKKGTEAVLYVPKYVFCFYVNHPYWLTVGNF